jgi:hypothetical protein
MNIALKISDARLILCDFTPFGMVTTVPLELSLRLS